MTFAPHLEVLPSAQRELWPELRAVPTRYVLYGGTALALRLGHRASADFDFFAHDALDHRELEALPFFRGATTLQETPDARTVIASGVKLSFFGGIRFGRVGEPDIEGGVRVASLLDLAGTKLKALLQRVEAKDYLDIAALLAHGVSLPEILGATAALFGSAFNPITARKALCYFEGGDLAGLDAAIRRQLETAASADVQPADIRLSASTL